MIALRLLLTRLHLIDSAVFECLTLLLLLGEIVEVTLIAVLRKGEPVHHVTGIVEIEERHQFIADLIDHLRRDGEVQRLALYGLQLFGNALDVIVNQDRRLIDGEFLTHGELSETAVIGNEMCQIRHRLSSTDDR